MERIENWYELHGDSESELRTVAVDSASHDNFHQWNLIAGQPISDWPRDAVVYVDEFRPGQVIEDCLESFLALVPIISAAAKDILVAANVTGIQYLPAKLSVAGEDKGPVFIMNATSLLSALDRERTVYKTGVAVRYALRDGAVPHETWLFRFREQPGTLLFSQRFVDLVSESSLTGFAFERAPLVEPFWRATASSPEGEQAEVQAMLLAPQLSTVLRGLHAITRDEQFSILPEAAERLRRLIVHEDPNIRAHTVRVLGLLRPPAVVEWISGRLAAEGDEAVATEAISALERVAVADSATRSTVGAALAAYALRNQGRQASFLAFLGLLRLEGLIDFDNSQLIEKRDAFTKVLKENQFRPDWLEERLNRYRTDIS